MAALNTCPKIDYDDLHSARPGKALSQKYGDALSARTSKAHEKGKCIDETKNCVLKSVHPSPLSSYRGFFGCKHFSKTNEYLVSKGKNEIVW